MTNQLEIVLITGAGRRTGIGFEVARQLGARGFRVLLTARRAEDAAARAAELRAEGLDVSGMRLDVTDPTQIAAVTGHVRRDFGRLDVLINNAAATAAYGETVAQADLTVARGTFEQILFGTWRMTQAFLPLLELSAAPRVVNVSSGAGSHADTAFGLTTANSMGASYALAKAAVNALTAKFAAENPRLRINAVCPGFTATFEGGAAMGARPVADGAASVVWAAVLPPTGATGGFFRDGVSLGW